MNTRIAVATAASLLLLSACSAPTTSTRNGSTAVETASGQAGADSQYSVAIKGSHQTRDYSGKRSLVVDFTFKNNSKKATSFMVAVSAKAFQKGVELETAVVSDKSFDAGASMKDIKPGASTEVQEAYLLTDKSNVSVEVTELFSFSDTPLATKTFALK